MSLPALQPVCVAVISRPAYDNAQICSLRKWLDDNANTLARYWRDLGTALGFSDKDNSEFDIWLTVQWEVERGRTRLPHGESL